MATSKAEAEKDLNDLEEALDKLNMNGSSCHIKSAQVGAVYTDDDGKLKWIERTIMPIPF